MTEGPKGPPGRVVSGVRSDVRRGQPGTQFRQSWTPSLGSSPSKASGLWAVIENRRPAGCREQPWVCVSARCPGRQLTPAPDPPLETVPVPPGAVLQASGHGIHSSRSSHVAAPPVRTPSSRCALIKGQPCPEAADAPGRDFRVPGLSVFAITLGPVPHCLMPSLLSVSPSTGAGASRVPWGWRAEEEASPVAQGPRV